MVEEGSAPLGDWILVFREGFSWQSGNNSLGPSCCSGRQHEHRHAERLLQCRPTSMGCNNIINSCDIGISPCISITSHHQHRPKEHQHCLNSKSMSAMSTSSIGTMPMIAFITIITIFASFSSPRDGLHTAYILHLHTTCLLILCLHGWG